ncbi:MAG: FAD-binding protein [Solirubrobacterales bacterium]|nr:FAD-binding protein [Solirubrobacterales bacterium]
MDRLETQVAVVGAGAAGLYTAIRAAREGADVVLISATPLAQSSTYWAQGGLAAAVGADDSPELHLTDTVSAGRGAVRASAAEVLCREAPAAVQDLADLGVAFDRDPDGRLALGLEGGHSARRIVHAGGAATGQRLIRRLSGLVSAEPGIQVLEGGRAVSVLVGGGRCTGIALGDGRRVISAATVLATGGAAALWSRTTNPPAAVGGGLLLAAAAGAQLADLELVQFHPTALAAGNGADGLLVTEAIRGEGALLLDSEGHRFVDELAPRDVVARAVAEQAGLGSVSLDMRRIDPAHFPNVFAALRQAGIDAQHDLVPVAPAAHYMMGGVACDLDARSTLPALYVVGECSCTGLHGANRLASNSLTECFVFGARAARSAAREPAPADQALESTAGPGGPPAPSPATRRALWQYAGLERDAGGLQVLLEDPHPLARLIAACGLARTESRGAHRRRDHPRTVAQFDGLHATVRPGPELEFDAWL